MLTGEDFEKIKVPIALFPSQDEPIDEVRSVFSRDAGKLLTLDLACPLSVYKSRRDHVEQAVRFQERLQDLSHYEPRLGRRPWQPHRSGRQGSVRGRVREAGRVLPEYACLIKDQRHRVEM